MRARVLSLLRAHGFDRTSFQVLEPGFSYWLCPEGCVTVACLAPACAAAVLWGAHATRARGT